MLEAQEMEPRGISCRQFARAALQNRNGRNVRLLWDGPNMKCTNIPEANRFVRNELREL